MKSFDVVIVGAGHAGAQLALALRQKKYGGSVLLIGDEPHHPYERPPLSKEYLARLKAFERLLIRPPSFWLEKAIELALGCQVVSIDADSRLVNLASGETIGYGELVWAAGGHPRPLSCEGAGNSGVHAVRTRQHVDDLMAALDRGAESIVIVGGGYIGLEAAAVLSKLGRNVTLLEATPRLLSRVTGPEISSYVERVHTSHGVKIRTATQASEILGTGGRVTAVRTSDGDRLPADIVIVGIGLVPTVEPLRAAGAHVSDGVEVDEYCRTSIPRIYAIGDCARHRNPYANGQMVRLESVQNANDMAQTVAQAICGSPSPYVAIPWFWSNQYDMRLQTVGLSAGYHEVVSRGNPDNRRFSAIYLRDQSVIALDCINCGKDYVQGKALIKTGTKIEPSLLADDRIPLGSL